MIHFKTKLLLKLKEAEELCPLSHPLSFTQCRVTYWRVESKQSSIISSSLRPALFEQSYNNKCCCHVGLHLHFTSKDIISQILLNVRYQISLRVKRQLPKGFLSDRIFFSVFNKSVVRVRTDHDQT